MLEGTIVFINIGKSFIDFEQLDSSQVLPSTLFTNTDEKKTKTLEYFA